MISKPRNDWFQTERAVTLSVMKRGLAPESVKVSYADDFLTIAANDETIFAERLASPVDKSKFRVVVTPRKVELEMEKASFGSWERLVADAPAPKVGPRSSVNWDKLEKEAIEEEAREPDDGDTGMQKALQTLYRSADADAQRAMMKSFVESNGTVLNMDWGEVAKKRVEVSAPDGMELKKY